MCVCVRAHCVCMHVCINTIIHVCVHVRELKIFLINTKPINNKKMHTHSTRACMLAPVFVACVCVCLCTCFGKLCVEVAIYIDKPWLSWQ